MDGTTPEIEAGRGAGFLHKALRPRDKHCRSGHPRFCLEWGRDLEAQPVVRGGGAT